jgi:cytochrome bd ubiquinol oxidase subunit I
LAHPVALAGPLFAAASTADLVAARSQMALTLGFHIVLACLGVALPTLMLIAEGRAPSRRRRRHAPREALVEHRRGDVRRRCRVRDRALVRARAPVAGSDGPVRRGVRHPFAVEGIFFFLEAIFVAVYIYGWDRLSPRVHFLSGIPIARAGLGGTFSPLRGESQPPT